MNGTCNFKLFFLAPPPGALGRGQKVQYHLISITKSISKIFIPNFVCVLTNERYKTYQTGFSFCPLGHAPGVGLWGAGGAQGVNFFYAPAIYNGGHIASPLYVRTYVRTGRTKNGFRAISFENIGVLDSYFIHRYISIKYRSSLITDKIHRLLSVMALDL